MSTSTSVKVPFVDLNAQYVWIKEEIQEAIEEVLGSAHYVGGTWVERFEEEFSKFVGAKYAVAVGSGTAALELALKAAGIGIGHDVIVPANTFFATAEAVTNVGAHPIFADVDPLTCHLDVSSVQRVSTASTRAVIPVHLYGRAMAMAELEQFAALHSITIIEDACQAHGAERDGLMVGVSGHLCCFSFYPGKNLGAYGDGGAVTGDNPRQIEMIRLMRDHGSPAKYQHSVVGTNSRLDAIQAGVLTVKLPYVTLWNSMRRQHATTYARAFAGSPVSPPPIPPGGEHNFHLFVVRSQQRDALREHLLQKGINAAIHYPAPVHLTKAYQDRGAPGPGSLPVCEALSQEILSLPMYPELSAEQIEHVVRTTLVFAGA